MSEHTLILIFLMVIVYEIVATLEKYYINQKKLKLLKKITNLQHEITDNVDDRDIIK